VPRERGAHDLTVPLATLRLGFAFDLLRLVVGLHTEYSFLIVSSDLIATPRVTLSVI